VFPTTIWTTIRQAAASDRAALEGFAERYRTPVLRYVRSRGLQDQDAEDLCQEVFVRILRAGLLEKADRTRGRFRGLLLTVARNAVTDRYRRGERTPRTAELEQDLEPQATDPEPRDPEFDQGWAWHLTERALERLADESPGYRDVLQGHLDGMPQDRNKLWIARKKLAALLKNEVAFTCQTQADFEDELAYLAQYLRPSARAAIDGSGGGAG
jgi:RNA polymerase sigma factor (sigma-70 family)